MEQDGRAENRLVLADRQIATDMIEQIAGHAIRSITKENRQLTENLAFLEDAIAFGGIDKWRWVGSFIEDFTCKGEVDKLMEGLPPESKFHNNRDAVRRTVNCLIHWRKEGVLSEHTLMQDAVDILIGRLVENMQLLGNLP